jgi:hypothetical protein
MHTPNHLPLFINVETKEDAVADVVPGAGLTSAVLYDADACNKMDEEIKSVFGSELAGVITPDEIRGSYATLREATIAGNLPTLSQSRGKIFFIMQGGAEEEYIASHNTLQGRAMFMYTGNKNDDHACFIIKTTAYQVKPKFNNWWARVLWCAPAPMPIRMKPEQVIILTRMLHLKAEHRFYPPITTDPTRVPALPVGQILKCNFLTMN